MKAFLFAILVSLQSQAEAKNVSTQGGRYQLIQLSEMRRDQYLIDTETGRIWTPNCQIGASGADCDYSAWLQQDVEGLNKTSKQIVEKTKYLESLKSDGK